MLSRFVVAFLPRSKYLLISWLQSPTTMIYEKVKRNITHTHTHIGLPSWLSDKESFCNARDMVSIPGLGRYPAKENSNPLQYSFLEYTIDREAWWAIVHGATKGQTQLKRLSMHTYIYGRLSKIVIKLVNNWFIDVITVVYKVTCSQFLYLYLNLVYYIRLISTMVLSSVSLWGLESQSSCSCLCCLGFH